MDINRLKSKREIFKNIINRKYNIESKTVVNDILNILDFGSIKNAKQILKNLTPASQPPKKPPGA